MVILLSIKPEYTKKIFSGEKKFEFRKLKPKSPPSVIYIYESYPTKLIVGRFNVKKILSGTPQEIWDRCKKYGGIGEEDFFKYTLGKELIFAYEIEKVVKFPTPIDPTKYDPSFIAPQSFAYYNCPPPYHELDEQKGLEDVGI